MRRIYSFVNNGNVSQFGGLGDNPGLSAAKLYNVHEIWIIRNTSHVNNILLRTIYLCVKLMCKMN